MHSVITVFVTCQQTSIKNQVEVSRNHSNSKFSIRHWNGFHLGYLLGTTVSLNWTEWMKMFANSVAIWTLLMNISSLHKPCYHCKTGWYRNYATKHVRYIFTPKITEKCILFWPLTLTPESYNDICISQVTILSLLLLACAS